MNWDICQDNQLPLLLQSTTMAVSWTYWAYSSISLPTCLPEVGSTLPGVGEVITTMR